MHLTAEELEELARRARSAEAYFRDRDRFLAYVESEVNPARRAEGLEIVSMAAASHLFDVIKESRYRK